MQVLTPSGYQSPVALANRDELCAFRRNGRRIVNRVDNIDFVDYREWRRWWRHHDRLPPFNWVRINGEHVLFCEQSVWRDRGNVCHARDLVVGDELYDDEDDAFLVESIEIFEDRDRVWYRFDVSGDHSYIVDGLTVHNASRFWVGGTGTWDSSTTTNWAATSGGAGGQSVPGSGDTVTFDGSSGGGTVTLNFGGTITIQSLTMGAFTGTFDNSVHNNNITVTNASGNVFNISGSGARTIKLGTATYTLSGNSAVFNTSTITNLTYSGNTGANIVFSAGGTGQRQFNSGNIAHGNVTVGAAASGGGIAISNSGTFNSLSISPPNQVFVSGGLSITNAFNWVGTSTNQIGIGPSAAATAVSITNAAGSVAQWCSLYNCQFTNSPVATDSFDLGGNTGITITSPSSGGGGAHFSATVF